jgi:hypothetical protein
VRISFLLRPGNGNRSWRIERFCFLGGHSRRMSAIASTIWSSLVQRSSSFASKSVSVPMARSPANHQNHRSRSIKCALTKSVAASPQGEKHYEKSWNKSTGREATIRNARRLEHPGFPAATDPVNCVCRQQEQQSINCSVVLLLKAARRDRTTKNDFGKTIVCRKRVARSFRD